LYYFTKRGNIASLNTQMKRYIGHLAHNAHLFAKETRTDRSKYDTIARSTISKTINPVRSIKKFFQSFIPEKL